MFFTGQQRPSTGKEARRQRSAKITADLENDAPVFDDDFYRYDFVCLTLLLPYRASGALKTMTGTYFPLSLLDIWYSFCTLFI